MCIGMAMHMWEADSVEYGIGDFLFNFALQVANMVFSICNIASCNAKILTIESCLFCILYSVIQLPCTAHTHTHTHTHNSKPSVCSIVVLLTFTTGF